MLLHPVGSTLIDNMCLESFSVNLHLNVFETPSSNLDGVKLAGTSAATSHLSSQRRRRTSSGRAWGPIYLPGIRIGGAHRQSATRDRSATSVASNGVSQPSNALFTAAINITTSPFLRGLHVLGTSPLPFAKKKLPTRTHASTGTVCRLAPIEQTHSGKYFWDN